MRTTLLRSLALINLLLSGILLSGCSRPNGSQTEVEWTEETTLIAPPAIPAGHQDHLRALGETRRIAFVEASADECLKELSQSLGTEIRLHDELRKSLNGDRFVSIETEEAVSHLTALRLAMQQVGHYSVGLVFEDDAIVLVRQEYSEPALRTLDLRGRADFSLAKRQRLIRDAVNEVQPDSWGSGTWIQPGESVFEVDVYHTSDMHMEVSNLLQTNNHSAVLDEELMTLGVFPRLKKGEKKVDQVKVVERLRKRFPYESVVDRLEYEAGSGGQRTPKLSVDAEKRLVERDSRYAGFDLNEIGGQAMRAESLRRLHEEEVATFIGRPGAGLARMPPPGPYYLPSQQPQEMPLASAEMIRSGDESPVELPATQQAATARRVFLPARDSMQQLHFRNESVFASTPSFGYIKDKRHVAGFTSHGLTFIQRVDTFKKRPWYVKAKELWAIHRMELVSLLKHKQPAVYISRNVPRLEELRDAKTRSLNEFEHAGLKRLFAGEDVVMQSSLNRIEMLGSLRASKECLQCHAVKRGTLLGVFSYELLRDPQIDPKEHQQLDVGQTFSLVD